MAIPRGIRNRNPGNIERGAPWQGLAADQSSDPRFAVFEHERWGIRAIARILITYQDQHGINTVRGIVNRWAPPHENDTSAYVDHVAEQCGVGPDEPIDVFRYEIMRPLVEAIIRHENGMQPYSAMEINEGLQLAGIDPPTEARRAALDQVRPLGETRTVQAGKVAAGATAASAVVEAAQELAAATQPIMQYLEIAKWIFLAATVIGIGAMLYARVSDRREGRR